MAIGQELGGYPDSSMSHNELVDHVANMQKTVEFYLGGNLDTQNAREFGGWQIKPNYLMHKTGNVGLHSGPSTGSDAADPVRIWAGDKSPEFAPFRVHHSGKVVMTNADITGSITMTDGNIIWGNVPPPDYSQIAGMKPPADANNTYSELLYNSGIRGFVNVGGTLFLSADYIRAGTIAADMIRGGIISGVTISVDTDLSVGNQINLGGNFNEPRQIWLNESAVITQYQNELTISADYLRIQGSDLTFDVPTSNIHGLPASQTAVFG